jgi:hypothetical protein
MLSYRSVKMEFVESDLSTSKYEGRGNGGVDRVRGKGKGVDEASLVSN